MRVKKKLNTHRVDLISGTPSLALLEHCPDLRHVFPSTPCTNLGCDYIIKQAGYMNCTFVAAEAGDHTLDQIGEMMGITREGVRLIEKRGLKKLKLELAQLEQHDTTLCESNASTGTDYVEAAEDVTELPNQADDLRAVNGRKLAQR